MAERITGHTELIGLMAYPIRHSNSPAMQNEAFAKLGYDYAYLAFEVGADEIEDAVKAIRTLKMRGSMFPCQTKLWLENTWTSFLLQQNYAVLLIQS